MNDFYYDDWKSGYYDDQPAYECKDCEEKEQKIDDISENFQSLVKQLYSGPFMDEVKLQDCIDNICWLLNLPVPEKMLKVKRLPSYTLSGSKEILLNTKLKETVAV